MKLIMRTRTHIQKRSETNRLSPGIAGSMLLVFLACSSVPPHPEISVATESFSREMAEAHLSALAELGARWPDSEEEADARSYLVRELELAGAAVRGRKAAEREPLVARIRGRSVGQVVVVLPLSSLGSMSWIDDSGLVLGLELARVFGLRDEAYDLVLVFADIRAPRVGGGRDQGDGSGRFVEIESPIEARDLILASGDRVLEALEADDTVNNVNLAAARAVIVLEPQTRQAMRIARDLPSHPVFRSLFWETAAALGHGDTFPLDAPWASPIGLQGAFHSAGISRLLTVVDQSTVLGERVESAEGANPPSAMDYSERLAPLGAVTVEALIRLMERFERIDAFSE